MERRSARDAREVLKGYSGYIICDGYQGYDALIRRGYFLCPGPGGKGSKRFLRRQTGTK